MPPESPHSCGNSSWLFVSVVTVLLSLVPTNLANASASEPRALILYDGPSTGYSEGLISARSIANLLGHFSASYDIQPVGDYQSGQVEKLCMDLLRGQCRENPLAETFSRRSRSHDLKPSAG